MPSETSTPSAAASERADLDLAALRDELRSTLTGEVRFDGGTRAIYAHDASNYRQAPFGVVLPRSTDEVVAALAICRRHGAPVVLRGAGTSLAGQTTNQAVLLDLSRHLREILEIHVDEDGQQGWARVQPGVIRDQLADRTEAEHELTFGPDTSTHKWATLGGMIGNNSCGVHSVMAGRTSDNVEALDILLYDGTRMTVGNHSEEEAEAIINEGGRQGEIYARLRDLRDRYAELVRARYPDIPRRVSGYNLDELLPEKGFNVARALVGSEATLVTVLEARLRLIHSPPARTLLVLGYPDVFAAGDHVSTIMEHGPVGLEGIDDALIEDMRKTHMHADDIPLLPQGGGWLLVEFGGESLEESDRQAHALMDSLRKADNAPTMSLIDDRDKAARLWEIREAGLGATAHVPGEGDHWPGWEDAAVPPERLGDYLRDFRALMDRYGYKASLYGHFGQGCVHCRLNFDLKTADGLRDWRAFMAEAADLVVAYGGSVSGEHGDGQQRAAFLPKMYGEELMDAFREFKSIWDPEWKMNPGKVVEPASMTEHLRFGTDFAPPDPKTHFTYPGDDHSFAHATIERCVGLGLCRNTGSGTMCPSFGATLEEQHSTRGRARILGEMVRGEIITDGFRSQAVFEALDLCLACKGCKSDCPVGVDMATYKAEFLAHHYKGRLRPAAAYSMGLIMYHARVGGRLPRLTNAVMATPGLGRGLRKIGGLAPQRAIPPFAHETLRQWFARRPAGADDAPPVVLLPDTFNNFFHPEVGKAAVGVLERAGYRVVLPSEFFCCGRPLYDYGMLDRARRFLRHTVACLQPWARAGIPIVGLEPSCVSVFRDELKHLLPRDLDARRVTRCAHTLAEFLVDEADFEPPRLNRQAVVHGHCHHKAVMQMRAERELFARMGLDYRVLDSGCCGVAGAFGFERQHYELSARIGERGLLPEVRTADERTLILADGFSCKEQIRQMTDRRGLHTAQLLELAHDHGEAGPQTSPPEQHCPDVVLGRRARVRRDRARAQA